MKTKRPDNRWLSRARDVLAQGSTGTNSKRETQYIQGVFPTHITHGLGPYLFDFHNNKYLDFVCALGANILGYTNSKVIEAVQRQIFKGASHSLPTTLEVEVAEQIRALVPVAEKVRFLKNGDDATRAAVRIARTYTNRDFILSRGYHGHSDIWTSLTKPALGIKDSFSVTQLQDSFSLIAELKPAAVIVEALELEASEKWKEWLKALRKECTTYGTLLIFDEIITGFRVPKMTVSKWWGIEPDLICLGKGIANGYPLSVIGGKREIMDCAEYFVSTTFSGDAVALAAAQATMGEIETNRNLDDLWYYGDRLRNKLNALHPEIHFAGYGTRASLNATNLNTALFMQEACKAGILFGKAWFFNFAHLEENCESMVMNICEAIVDQIKQGKVKLEGEAPQEVFKIR